MINDIEKFNDSMCWQVGQWLFWPESGVLKQGNQEQRLSNQLNQVFCLLIQQAPHVVTRQQFLDVVWANKYVNEDALSRAIAELRKVLGDSASQAKYIKTIPKQGYQLTTSVEAVREKIKRRGYIAVFFLASIVLSLIFYSNFRKSVLEQLQESVAAAERFTAIPGMEQQTKISADGDWLSYSRNNNSESYIKLQNINDESQSQTIELARHRLSSPVYLPKHKKLLVTAKDQSQCYLKTYDLEQRLFHDLAACDFQIESRTTAWHEKEQLVLFSAPVNVSDKTIAIHQIAIDGSHEKQLTQPNDSSQDWSPQISPDHRWLSFSRGNHSVRNIWVKPWSEGEAFEVTFGAHYSVSHSWYDKEHIVFDSDRNGSRQLWLVNIFDKEPKLIGAYGAQHPTFDQDKSMMVYQEVSYEANIWLYERHTMAYNRLVHSTKYDNNPAFSPDGQSMIFSSNRQDNGSIWIYDFNSKVEQLLLSIPDTKLTRPFWHDDGKHVLITANDDSGYSTLKFNLITKQYTQLPFDQPNLSAQAIGEQYYAISKLNKSNYKIISLNDGRIENLPVDSVSRYVLLNENQLVYSKANKDGLYVYDINEAKETNVLPGYNKNAMNLWAAVNQSIYFDQSGVNSGLWRLDLITGEKELITKHRAFSVGTSLSVNTDENLILMTQTDRAESDVFKAQLN